MESSRPKEKRKTKEHITPRNGNRHEKDEQELDGLLCFHIHFELPASITYIPHVKKLSQYNYKEIQIGSKLLFLHS
ncbi:unnamed protein product [Schistosoma margrebowiei]|uniref:Uncharacterized protein n=1 Tax=Schistosoma margrebowiei TaxID=48269 RepID=A0A183N533_9TREM|nr:unnamed protein product [Schistosoma margrebowiei]